MTVGTVDSMQGSEKTVVIFFSVASQNTGPGFLNIKERLNVDLSRHCEVFLFVGDSNVCSGRRVKSKEYEEGYLVSNDAPWLGKVIKWFKEKGRIHTLR